MRFMVCVVYLNILLLSSAFAQNEFTLQSTAFNEQTSLPTLYTCDGKDVSPPLTWKNIPSKAKSFALIVSDNDAPTTTFYHWVLYNLSPNLRSLNQGIQISPNQGTVGVNSWNKQQYNGPCPPQGSSHHYQFTLYALDSFLPLAPGATADILLSAMQKHILAQSVLTVTFGH